MTAATMCVQDDEQVDQDMEKEDLENRRVSWPLHCDLLHTQMDNREKGSSFRTSTAKSLPVSIGFPCLQPLPSPLLINLLHLYLFIYLFLPSVKS